MKSLLSKLNFQFQRLFFEAFGLLSFNVLYRLADALAWLLEKFGYRRAVLWDNLRKCFPEKSDVELAEIAHSVYQNLADVTLEGIKGMTVPLPELERRIVFRNTEAVNRYLAAGQSVLLAAGHFDNWEWVGATLANQFTHQTVFAYKPLKNKHLDAWICRARSRSGRVIMRNMDATPRAFHQFKNDPAVFALIADQMPSNRRSAQWVTFLGRNTPCLPGVDLLARAHGMPVFWYCTHRTGRGIYELTLREICPNPKETAPSDITQAFMTELEKDIRREPGSWLWTHKRWKWEALNDEC